MTEPHAGTDVASYTTNTEVRGATLRLKGVKTLCSRAEEAGAFVVFTRINGTPGGDGIGCVLVEKGTPGLVLSGKFHTMGGEYLHEVRFEDCELPAENLLLGEGGFKKLLSAFNTQRCLNPSISLGLAEGAFDEALRYARERAAFGRPIGEFQGMRWKLADMYNEIEAGRGLLYRACATADPFPDPLLAAQAKVYLQRDVDPRHQRSDPDLRRLRLHRRVSGVAALSRRALRQPRRRHVGDAARPDRQAADGVGRLDRRNSRLLELLTDWRGGSCRSAQFAVPT